MHQTWQTELVFTKTFRSFKWYHVAYTLFIVIILSANNMHKAEHIISRDCVGLSIHFSHYCQWSVDRGRLGGNVDDDVMDVTAQTPSIDWSLAKVRKVYTNCLYPTMQGNYYSNLVKLRLLLPYTLDSC